MMPRPTHHDLITKAGGLRPVAPLVYAAQVWDRATARAFAAVLDALPAWVPPTADRYKAIPGIEAAYGKGYDFKSLVAANNFDDLAVSAVPKLWKGMRDFLKVYLRAKVERVGMTCTKLEGAFANRYRRQRGRKSWMGSHFDPWNSAVFQLGDSGVDYEGGGTAFPDHAFPDVAGRVLVFPGVVHFGRERDPAKLRIRGDMHTVAPWVEHRSLPVSKGTRIALVAFFR